MMGVQIAPAQLFYDFCLDDHVPLDHLLRRIDVFLDLDSVRLELKPFYSSIGRPSIDPELMMRMLIVGYCMGIRSERRLCEEVHLNLAYRWFCRLGLDGEVPDHSTFSRNRHGRFRQSDILRHLFETVVDRCLREGLVGGEGFAVDASLIAADANKQRSVPGDRYNVDDLGQDAGHAVREYLATLDAAAFGAASAVQPKFISPSDPAAQWTGAHKGHAFFAYATNYLIDTEHAIILDVEASRAIRQAEVGASRTMIDRTQERFGLKPSHLAADSAYGSARTWPGWSSSAASRRTSRCSTSPTAPTALSRDPISRSIRSKTATPVRRASCWCSSAGPTRRREPASPRMARGFIAPANATAMVVPSSHNAARTRRPARSRATSTRMPAMWPELSPPPRPMNAPGIAGRKWKCCSPTSSGSSGSAASGCAAPTAPEMSSCSPLPPKT
jgi:transposase